MKNENAIIGFALLAVVVICAAIVVVNIVMGTVFANFIAVAVAALSGIIALVVMATIENEDEIYYLEEEEF